LAIPNCLQRRNH
jgi:CRP-like cAMP-binding protein